MNPAKDKSRYDKIWLWLTVLLAAGFLFCGLIIFRDYGASSDEINQIEAGHIIWTAVCEKLGRPAPDFGKLPKLEEYYNRYYGQAATFPTVIIEALHGFRMDISSILRLRHFWNFLLYFCGTVCFAVLARMRFHRNDTVFFLLLLFILTPRLFGDAFYNDRDTMLVSLLWISLLSFALFLRRPGIPTALLCGFCFALAVNTRYFALVLLILPILRLSDREAGKKGNVWILLGAVIVFFYLLSPVLWNGFFKQFAEGFSLFSSGRQRTQETRGLATILFFGKYFPENDLPFYYVPLWIFISTPLVPQALALTGLVRSFREKPGLIDRFMQLFLCLGMAAVMLIRPVLYNGWRHMYFFYVPIFWFAGWGIDWLFSYTKRFGKAVAAALLLVSAGMTASRIAYLHPYEYIYLNPMFRSRTADFDRDYWRLSTTESLKWIWEQEQDEFRVNDTNAGIDNSIIALFPYQRERISISQYNALHRFPSKYLICNYSGITENAQDFPLYGSAYVIARDGVKMAEVFRRYESFIPPVRTVSPDMPEITDGELDLETEWRSPGPQGPEDEIVLSFEEPVTLRGLSLLPGDDEYEYARSPEVSVSDDGENWTPLPLQVSNLFDLSFSETTAARIRIRNTEPAEEHWSVREIMFY